MAVCRATSLSLLGIEAVAVEVEVDVSAGLPRFSIVGLPDAAVQEARERVRVAISNSGFRFPTKKVIVNLAPANLRKEGAAFDLPIALAILAAAGEVSEVWLEGSGMVGELSLDGGLRGVRGALSVAEGARREGLPRLVVPEANAPEAAAIGGVGVYGLRTLREAVDFLGGRVEIPAAGPSRNGVPGAAGSGYPAPALRRREHRGDQGPQRRGRGERGSHGRAALPGATLHHLDLRARRRREQPPAGGGVAGAPRCPLPRRAPRVQQADARSVAPAAGGRARHDLAGGGDAELPGVLHAGVLDEPVSVRLRGRWKTRVPVLGDTDRTLPGPHLRPFARPDRPVGGRPAPHARGAAWGRAEGAVGGYQGASVEGQGGADGAPGRSQLATRRAPVARSLRAAWRP